MSVARVQASLLPMTPRASYEDPSGSARANVTFHGHTSWEVSLDSGRVIELVTGSRTLRRAGA